MLEKYTRKIVENPSIEFAATKERSAILFIQLPGDGTLVLNHVGVLIFVMNCIIFYQVHLLVLIPVVVQSKAYVYTDSLAGNVGTNPTGAMDVCLL